MLSTYAGDGKIIDIPQRPGFRELEYREGPWYYRDSYAGYIRSVGHEVVWFNDVPFWSSIYGGGMTEEFSKDNAFTNKTFEFLKKAMSAGDKVNTFQPRGPRERSLEAWRYSCDWNGDISDFKGSEAISYEGTTVFTHDFRGGIIDWGKDR